MAYTRQEGPGIEVDYADPFSSNDSAYGDELEDYTQSLTSSIQQFEFRHGRRYHTFGGGAETYPLPNDEQEQERLDIMSHVIKLTLSGRLFLAPLPLPGGALRVLDLGTGTGIWAIELGDAYPQCTVIGNDLSPIQPRWVPANVQFEVDDITEDWPEREPFDFIHGRYLAGSVPDWPRLMQQCYENLAPGGWVEFQDFDLKHYSEDNSVPEGNNVQRIHDLLIEACERVGRTLVPGRNLKRWAEEAGFQNIREEIFRVPLGLWPKDPRLKEIGAFHLAQLLHGMEGFCIELFTRVLNWSQEQVQLFLADVRKDSKNRTVHLMFNFHVVYGQRLNGSRPSTGVSWD